MYFIYTPLYQYPWLISPSSVQASQFLARILSLFQSEDLLFIFQLFHLLYSFLCKCNLESLRCCQVLGFDLGLSFCKTVEFSDNRDLSFDETLGWLWVWLEHMLDNDLELFRWHTEKNHCCWEFRFWKCLQWGVWNHVVVFFNLKSYAAVDPRP